LIEKSIPISDVLNLPLDIHEQEKAVEENIPSVKEGRLKTYSPDGENVKKLLSLLKTRLTRQVVGSMVGCVHCGMCTDSCHYALARPDDPTMAPAYKADQIRRIFKKHFDWTGRIVPWWVHADDPKDDEDLNRLKNIVFGTCTGCRRCTSTARWEWTPRHWFALPEGFFPNSALFPKAFFK